MVKRKLFYFLIRFFWEYLLIISLCIVILGCSQKDSGKEKTLELWTISLKPYFTDYMENTIAKFEQKEGIKVKWLDIPLESLQQKLMASLAAKNPPDLVNLNTYFLYVLAKSGVLLPLEDKLTQEERNRYLPFLWEANCIGGKCFALPWYVSTKLIIFNKKIFSKAGLPPKAPGSREEIIKFARKIKERTNFYGFMPAISLTEDFQLANVPILDNNGEAVFARPEAANILEEYQQLIKDKVIPPETLTEGYQGAVERYQGDELGMLITGPQFLLRIKDNSPEVYLNTDVGYFPAGKKGKVPVSVMNLAIIAKEGNQKEAVKLALFITSPECQVEFAHLVPVLPSTRESLTNPFFTSLISGDLMAKARVLSAKQLERGIELTVKTTDITLLNKLLKEALERTCMNGEDPLKMLSFAEEEFNKFKKERKEK